MTNSKETDRDVTPPRIISIPGSDLDTEVKHLHQLILAHIGSGRERSAASGSLLDAVSRLAEIENW